MFLLAGSEVFDTVPLQVAMMVMNEQTELSQGLRTLPLLTRAVVVGEAFRRAVLAVHRVPSVTLAGKDADGTPLIWQHRHAHYVADCRGTADPVHGGPLRITHVVVYAPGGLTPSEVTALLGVRYLPSYVYGTEVAETERLAVTLGGLGQVAGLHALASSAVSTSHRRSTSSRNRATCGDLRFPFAARRASFRSRLESTSVNGVQTSADYDCGSCFWNRNTPRGRVFDPRNGISPMCCQPSPRRQSTKLCG